MRIQKIISPGIYCIIFLFSISGNYLLSQPKIEKTNLQNLEERVAIITDRDIYCINENLYFRAYNLSNEALKESEWSKVLYIEIITPTGKPVFQGKYEYSKEGTDGKIEIPKEILTGNYYLRAYTRWMRNYSPYSYFYKLIKIINPFNKELLSPSDEAVSSVTITTDSLQQGPIQISTNKETYGKREAVTVTSILNNNIEPLYFASITVAKRNSFIQNKILEKNSNNIESADSAYYIPETRGLTLTGRIVDAKDSLPINNAQVNLTIFNSPTKSYSIPSTNTGQFFFSLPNMQGTYEVFASTNETLNEKPTIMMVDNDFCTRTISLPFVPIADDEHESKYLNELSFNTQMEQFYVQKVQNEEIKDSTKTSQFYGQPSYSILFKDFIELPTMQDYFVELLTNVGIRKKSGKRYFKISGMYPELNIYEPLVLVDFVPVSNVEWVLSISPRKIKKIDIIEEPFVRGNMIFGGIISIISLDGDFAGVNLPSSGQFFNYGMYSKEDDTFPEISTDKRTPDLRNVLYWNPDISLSRTSETNLQFTTSDVPGEYYIVIEGFTNEGKKISSYKPFIVN